MCASITPFSHAELMLSKYIDGSSNRKGLEIYNPDNRVVNLSDYQIVQYSNGSVTPSATFTLANTQLASQKRFVIGRTELQQEIGSKVNQTANLAYNGDDALVLTNKGVPVDRFGRVGERPALGWGGNPYSIANSFSRKEQQNNVSSIDSTTAFDLNASWSALTSRNDFSVLGDGGGVVTPPTGEPLCSDPAVSIASLQEATLNQIYTVRGVITADYRYANGFNGFYIQTPDSQSSTNISNAIFVYVPANASSAAGGTVGDDVVIRGSLQTFQGQRQLTQLQGNVVTCGTASNLVSAKPLQLPFSSLQALQGNSPALYNGMLVSFPQKLTVSENYNYGRYGELALSHGRMFIPTMLYAPNSPEAKQQAANNLLNKIILDDGYNNQNRTPWLASQLSHPFDAFNSLRSGYQVCNVTGILEYRFNQWRIQPVQGQAAPVVDASSNPRVNAPARAAGSDTRVVAFNVLNYDNGSKQGFPTERGAKTKVEFDKQHAKIVSAMKQIDADVFGLMEIANNGYADDSAIAYLTRGLGSDWTYVKPETANQLGTDAIAVGIIYNKTKVKPVGKAVTLDLGNRNRSVIAQSFMPVKGGKMFTVVPNHLKSKGCGEIEPDDIGGMLNDNQGDGQSCWAPTRVAAVEKLTNWLARDPAFAKTNSVIVLGDLNSYAKEDPIRALEQRQYINLVADQKIGVGENAYSYVFGVASDANGYGGAGTLDYAFASKSLLPLVKKAQIWHINADEPTVLSYEESFKSPEQITAFYADHAYRSSDHDPVIVDLALGAKPQQHDNPVIKLINAILAWLSSFFR
jgi:predicted extracellular nuclease